MLDPDFGQLDVPLREITELNTQVRILSVISHLLRTLGRQSLPEEIIKRDLIEWSSTQESLDVDYCRRTGKLTNNRKPTAAFRRYLTFAKALGLVENIGRAYRRSRLGTPLSALLQSDDSNTVTLSDKEKIFYFLILLWRDADPILCLLDRISTEPSRGTRQLDLQREFQDLYQIRLKARIEHSSGERARQIMLTRLTAITSKWTNPEKYAEHIVPPRLEWLKDIGILRLDHERSKTCYFSRDFLDLYRLLPKIASTVTYVTDEWIWGSFMGFLGRHLLSEPYRLGNGVPAVERKGYLASLLEQAFAVFTIHRVPRIPLTTSFIYIVIRLSVDHRVIVDFKRLQDYLANKYRLGDRRYQIRVSPRENESYLVAMTV